VTPTLVDGLVRAAFARELLPSRLLWWFVAEGTAEWARVLRADLAPHLGGDDAARAAIAHAHATMLRRRYGVLREAIASLPAPSDRGIALTFGALARVASNVGAAWLFDDLGGAPRSVRDHAAAEELVAPLTMRARWEEVSCHLGELLIALTDELPARLPRARVVLGDLCFDAGARFGKKMRKAWRLGDAPGEALEVLRMSEYVFRVNPVHRAETNDDARSGMLEGSACPWYTAPGWNGAHCGIFGQFQSGISSAFGLRYHLTTTIPKHGGHTCRIDVKPLGEAPIALRRKDAARGVVS
jgi:hypothetical protein